MLWCVIIYICKGRNVAERKFSCFAQGPQAHEAGVEFPAEAEVLDRTLLVGNLNPIVTVDQVSSCQCPSPLPTLCLRCTVQANANCE